MYTCTQCTSSVELVVVLCVCTRVSGRTRPHPQLGPTRVTWCQEFNCVSQSQWPKTEMPRQSLQPLTLARPILLGNQQPWISLTQSTTGKTGRNSPVAGGTMKTQPDSWTKNQTGDSPECSEPLSEMMGSISTGHYNRKMKTTNTTSIRSSRNSRRGSCRK